MTLKIVVIGYGEMFAAIIKSCIEAGHDVVGVMRHEKVLSSPLKLFFKNIFAPSHDYNYIKSLRLHEIKAQSANSEEFAHEVLKLNADLIFVASWSERLKRETIILPKLACINCHPSLLPKYRGPNPYLQVIKHAETQTGVTFHLMDTSLDTGEILLQKIVPILPNDTGKILRTRCANTARECIKELLFNLQNNVIFPVKQDENYASYFPQINFKDVLLDFSKNSTELDRQLRAITDWQACYFRYKNDFFKVKKHVIHDNTTKYNKVGTIVDIKKRNMSILLSDNKIIELQNVELYGFWKHYLTRIYLTLLIKKGASIYEP